ncbi:MAG: hypothetical protein U0414_11535 [Polyangiaceae bacterium]
MSKPSAPRFASLLALAALIAAPSSALAKDWMTLPTRAGAAVGTPEHAALDALATDAATLGIEGLELSARETVGTGSTLTVLIEQRWGGLRVLDKGGAVRFERGEPRRVAMDVARGLSISTVPALDASEASLKLATKVGHALAPFRSELAVIGRGGGVLVWVLDVREDGTRYVVDANTGKLELRIPVVLDAKGRVYAVNQVETPMPVDLPLATLDESAAPVHLDGWSGLLQVTNYVSGSAGFGYELEQTLVPSSGTDFLYNPPADPFDPKDAFAQVNLYYHLTDMREFFASLGVNETTPNWKLTAVANAMEDGSPLDNAFFSPFGQSGQFEAPNVIGIGQGSQIDFAYDSDVFKHEFGHYVAGNTVNFNLGPFYTNEYGLQPLSAAIDEGLADYYACSDNDSGVLGEAALAPFGAQRDLTVTSKRCPDDVGLESHADGELIGSVSWSLRVLLGQAKADKLVWGAETLLGAGATFGDFYQGLVTTMNGMIANAELTDADAAGINKILADRGLDDCGPVIAIEDGETKRTIISGLELLSYYLQQDCFSLIDQGFLLQSPFHFSRKTSPADSAVHFHLEMSPDFPDATNYTVLIRKGDHVTYTVDNNGLPNPLVYDYAFQGSDEFETDIVIDQNSSPPFEPGATYFVSVSSASCPNLSIALSTDSKSTSSSSSTSATSSHAATSGSGTPGSGGDGGGGPRTILIDRGCGCFVASENDTRAGAFIALALGGAAAARRRRSRAR